MSTMLHDPTITLVNTNPAHAALPDGVVIPGSSLTASAIVTWDYDISPPLRVRAEWGFGWGYDDGIEIDPPGYKFENYTPSPVEKVGVKTFQAMLNFPPPFPGWQQSPETSGVVYGRYTLDFWAYDNYDEDNPRSLKEVNYYAYSVPSITTFSIQRCNFDGGANEAGIYAKVQASYAITALGDNNTKALKIKYRQSGAESWSEQEITLSAYSGTITPTVLSATFDADKTYDILAELSDLLNTATNQKTLTPAYALMHLNADKDGIGIGKYSEGPGLDIGMDTIFRMAPSIPDPAERAAFVDHLGIGLAALGIQMGSVSTKLPTGGNKTGDVTFDYEYDTPPFVFLQLRLSGGATNTVIRWQVSAVTTTGFTWFLNSNGSGASACEIFWLALGQ